MSGKKRYFNDDDDGDEEDRQNKTTSKSSSFVVLPVKTIANSSTNITDQKKAEEYPYPVNDDDHCETPEQAYQDISFILEKITYQLNKTKTNICIYDPYFCEGSMIERFQSLGYFNIYNRKEDFYEKIHKQTIPNYDILVTNPPYSGEHMEKLLQFCINSNKPYFLLLPNFVYTKEYYISLFSKQQRNNNNNFYIIPTISRYNYTTPKGRRQKKSAKYTAPFPTFWYCNVGKLHTNIFNQIDNSMHQIKNIVLCKNTWTLPLDIIPDQDPRKKKLKNAQKRKKHKSRKQQQTGQNSEKSSL